MEQAPGIEKLPLEHEINQAEIHDIEESDNDDIFRPSAREYFFIFTVFRHSYFFFPHFSATIRSGEARNIEEYVPKTIPSVSTSAKCCVDSGPKK